jgi:hypothetical protein
MGIRNESGLSNNNNRDVSISPVPAVGKRDTIVKTTIGIDGTTTETYSNRYLWVASDDWQEKIEQWLCIRSDYVYELFLTFACSRLLFKGAIALFHINNTLGLILFFGWFLGFLSLAFVATRKMETLTASWLRLFGLVLGVL